MTKCPNCGSTAQVKLISPLMPSLSHPDLMVKKCSCGCGCHFSAEYRRNEKGILEFYTNFIEYISKNS